MAKLKGKGTVWQMSISAVYTAIAQVISLDGPQAESETYEADTLDNASAGIPYAPTGRTEGGSLSGELFFDPVAATHQAITDLLTTPAASSHKLKFTDTAATEWPFSGAGVSFGPKVALNDGTKASFSVKLDGIPTYPT